MKCKIFASWPSRSCVDNFMGYIFLPILDERNQSTFLYLHSTPISTLNSVMANTWNSITILLLKIVEIVWPHICSTFSLSSFQIECFQPSPKILWYCHLVFIFPMWMLVFPHSCRMTDLVGKCVSGTKLLNLINFMLPNFRFFLFRFKKTFQFAFLIF